MNVMMSLTATPLLEYVKLPSNMALQSRMLLLEDWNHHECDDVIDSDTLTRVCEAAIKHGFTE